MCKSEVNDYRLYIKMDDMTAAEHVHEIKLGLKVLINS